MLATWKGGVNVTTSTRDMLPATIVRWGLNADKSGMRVGCGWGWAMQPFMVIAQNDRSTKLVCALGTARSLALRIDQSMFRARIRKGVAAAALLISGDCITELLCYLMLRSL